MSRVEAGTRARRRVWSCCACVALLAAGAAACGSSWNGDPAIREDELRAHVAVLAAPRLEGRMPGTAGYDEAAAYARDVLERAGVEPGWLARQDAGSPDPDEPDDLDAPQAPGHPATGTGPGTPDYFQTLSMVRNRVGPGTVLELRSDRSPRPDRTGRPERGLERLPHGRRTFLFLAAGNDGTGMPQARPPVFVGRALHDPEDGVDDLAGLDLRGRAVLLTASPPDSAELAGLPAHLRTLYGDRRSAQLRRLRDVVARGAAALLLLPDRWLVDDWDEVSARERRLDYAPVERYTGRAPGTPVPAAILHADLVDRLFLGRGYHPISHAGRYHTFELDDISLRLVLDIRREPFTTANVIGLVPGRDASLRHEYVLVSAPLDGEGRDGDRVFNGPGRAAACAALLEAAAAIAHDPPRRSVLFVLLTAEAGGRWGSSHLRAHPPVPADDLVAAIHVERVGAERPHDGDIEAFAAARLVELARGVRVGGRPGRLSVRGVSELPDAFAGTAAETFDRAGIPSVLLTDGELPEHPARGAGAADVDVPRLRAATRLLRALVVEVADAPAFQRPAAGAGRAPPTGR
jgi:hypothetical protein